VVLLRRHRRFPRFKGEHANVLVIFVPLLSLCIVG
jgi:hypothetical protein